jgi:hypothetical protein
MYFNGRFCPRTIHTDTKELTDRKTRFVLMEQGSSKYPNYPIDFMSKSYFLIQVQCPMLMTDRKSFRWKSTSCWKASKQHSISLQLFWIWNSIHTLNLVSRSALHRYLLKQSVKEVGTSLWVWIFSPSIQMVSIFHAVFCILFSALCIKGYLCRPSSNLPNCLSHLRCLMNINYCARATGGTKNWVKVRNQPEVEGWAYQ